jgi:uncharacterized protein DUF3485
MNRQKWIILVSTLLLIGSAAGLLSQLRAKQRLGPPAVRTSVIAGSPRLQVDLPERVLDCTSEPVETQKMALDMLPKDTSFGQRLYTAPDQFQVAMNVVLMGSDRTSLHKPEFCLMGAGWDLDSARSGQSVVHMERPCPYDLPITTLVTKKTFDENGQTVELHGVFVYWFVAPNEYTARHWQRMWWMAEDILRTGVLQRWASVSCFHVCRPGEEAATLERMKTFIAAAAPEFQMTPSPKSFASLSKP